MAHKTIARIQNEGYDAQVNALGPEDAIRFLRNFDHGGGITPKSGKNISRTGQ